MMGLKSRMTLARKILLRNVALLASLALLTGVAVWGLLRLRSNIDTLSKEYAELRAIDAVSRHVIAARGLINQSPSNPQQIRAELQAAIDELARYRADQEHNVEGSISHEQSEQTAAVDARADLLRVLEAIDDQRGTAAGDVSDRAGPLRGIDAALARLNRLIAEADELVAKTQRRAGSGALDALLVISGVFVIVAAVATLISRNQYRDIMIPLRRLREGARRMAEGRFGNTVPADGDREFAELAQDFNRMGAELQDLYRTLEEKVEQKSRELVRSERLASVGFLAAGVAHEINNPLGIMSGYAQLTLKRLRKEHGPAALSDVERTLEIIRDESFRCRQITEKLLSLSTPGSADRVPVRLAEVAEAVAGIVSAHERYRRRRVIPMLMQKDELIALADEAEMKQVLLNLVINALEAVEDDVGRVWIEGSSSNGTVRLSVRDNGCGMSPQTREQVFEPFFSGRRTGGKGDAHGVGLGLSIAHAIVESHGGRIWAESEGIGKGSRFVVDLPAALRPGDCHEHEAIEHNQ
jgi:signal transduction histidine kinase